MSLYCEKELEVNRNKYNAKINKIILKIKFNQSEYSSGSYLSCVLFINLTGNISSADSRSDRLMLHIKMKDDMIHGMESV